MKNKLKAGQWVKAVVTSDARNKSMKYPVNGEMQITEVSVGGEIMTANLYPNGRCGGFGGVTWPKWTEAV